MLLRRVGAALRLPRAPLARAQSSAALPGGRDSEPRAPAASPPAVAPEHVGIIGCSFDGAALCYRTLCGEAPGFAGEPYEHPEVTMHTLSLGAYLKAVHEEDWPAVGALLETSAHKLAAAGATFLICPCNTVHQALPHVRLPEGVPLLHIADAVAAEAKRRGLERVGVLGTRWLMNSPEVYPGTEEWPRPCPRDVERINAVVVGELLQGRFTAEGVAVFQDVIGRLRDTEGCDSIVMGCTEIPLLMNDENSPLPTLDSTRLLARAALARAYGA